MTRLACLLAIFAFPVFAETPSDRWQNGIQSFAEIVPINDGNCVAEILINNYPTDRNPAASGALVLGDLHVGISYKLNVGYLAAEEYKVWPPDGYIAIPSEIEVQDSGTGSVLICHYVGF
jgi:hypothetical protein